MRSCFRSCWRRMIDLNWRALSALLVVILGMSANNAAGQSLRTEHTYKLDDPGYRPKATLDDIAWLVGSWSGEAFGGSFEEVWNPPSGGSMVGMFKTLNGDNVGFYELMLLVEEEGSLSLKVKHFSAEFYAWEDKSAYVNFRFIKADEGTIHFSGFSLYRISDNEIHGYVVIREGEETREEKLVYKR